MPFVAGVPLVRHGARLNVVAPLATVVVGPLARVYPVLVVLRAVVRLPFRAKVRALVVGARYLARVLVVVVVDGRVFKRVVPQV